MYSSTRAAEDFEALEINLTSMEPENMKKEFIPLRNKLLRARDEVFEQHRFDEANELAYKFDIYFGMELYLILKEEAGFTNRVASNDNVWRYLSLKVIPDIVHSRWGMNKDHFYNKPRRIWLKQIYWYIELSYKKNKVTTLKLIEKNSTDTIQNLVERPGLGYQLKLYREIMYQYGLHGHNVNKFRKIMKLNTARCMVTVPDLYEGGVKGYVTKLFEDIGE